MESDSPRHSYLLLFVVTCNWNSCSHSTTTERFSRYPTFCLRKDPKNACTASDILLFRFSRTRITIRVNSFDQRAALNGSRDTTISVYGCVKFSSCILINNHFYVIRWNITHVYKTCIVNSKVADKMEKVAHKFYPASYLSLHKQLTSSSTM